MRIALVTPRYPPALGGVENHVQRLAQRAAERGHEVEVITQDAASHKAQITARDGVSVRAFPLTVRHGHYALSTSLGSYLRRYARNYDLVHAHNYHATPALLASLSGPRAFVFTPHYHGTSDSRLRRGLHHIYRPAGRAIVSRAQRVICVSGREAALLRRDFPASSEFVRVIPNGVDRREIDAAQPFAEPRRVVLSAGRLAHYKQVERILEAVAQLGDEYSLCVTGDGPERDALAARAGVLGLGPRAAFRGVVERDELLRWFKTARVYVTMSRIEAMPLTPLEVLAAGTPVVASDIDAHREIAESSHGSMELISPDASPHEVASAIDRAASCVVTEAETLDWTEVGDRTLEVYEEIAG